jgi:hypothetical protein
MEPATHAPTPMPFVSHVNENWDILTAAYDLVFVYRKMARQYAISKLPMHRRVMYDDLPHLRVYDDLPHRLYQAELLCYRLRKQMYRDRRAPRVVVV